MAVSFGGGGGSGGGSFGGFGGGGTSPLGLSGVGRSLGRKPGGLLGMLEDKRAQAGQPERELPYQGMAERFAHAPAAGGEFPFAALLEQGGGFASDPRRRRLPPGLMMNGLMGGDQTGGMGGGFDMQRLLLEQLFGGQRSGMGGLGVS